MDIVRCLGSKRRCSIAYLRVCPSRPRFGRSINRHQGSGCQTKGGERSGSDLTIAETSRIGWDTHVHVRRETSWELREGREGRVKYRRHGAPSERILVPEAFLLPVVPDFINHLYNHVVR